MGTRISLIFLSIFFILSSFFAFAQKRTNLQINDFQLKETLLKNDKLAIIACDSLENPKEDVNGTFQFTINGFSHLLNFHNGVATTPNKIEHSTFVFIKHRNDAGTHSHLYYVIKNDNDLQIYTINWFLLLIIPLALFFLVMLFKRFFWIAVVLLMIYLYFNYQNGLNPGNFVEAVLHGIKNWLF